MAVTSSSRPSFFRRTASLPSLATPSPSPLLPSLPPFSLSQFKTLRPASTLLRLLCIFLFFFLSFAVVGSQYFSSSSNGNAAVPDTENDVQYEGDGWEDNRTGDMDPQQGSSTDVFEQPTSHGNAEQGVEFGPRNNFSLKSDSNGANSEILLRNSSMEMSLNPNSAFAQDVSDQEGLGLPSKKLKDSMQGGGSGEDTVEEEEEEEGGEGEEEAVRNKNYKMSNISYSEEKSVEKGGERERERGREMEEVGDGGGGEMVGRMTRESERERNGGGEREGRVARKGSKGRERLGERRTEDREAEEEAYTEEEMPLKDEEGKGEALQDLRWREFTPELDLNQFFERPKLGRSSEGRKPCSEKRGEGDLPEISGIPSTGFVHFVVSGGLNQQKRGLANAVVVARILNATLVLPQLAMHKAWMDGSSFADIYNVDTFMEVLRDDIHIVREMPAHLKQAAKKSRIMMEGKHHPPEWYIDNVLPILRERQVAVFSSFVFKLSPDLSIPLQRLRCRAAFHALQFVEKIERLGLETVSRLRQNGPFLAIHLRFEPDWLAHAGCKFYDQSSRALKVRKRNIEGGEENCPITPRETAIIFKAIGVGKETKLYLAAGTMVGGNQSLAPLYDAFPGQIETKSSVLGRDLDELGSHATMHAAVDYLVCLHSDYLVLTAGSNMGNMLTGHRFYLDTSKVTMRLFKGRIATTLTRRRVWMKQLAKTLHFDYERHFAKKITNSRRVNGTFYSRPWECVCEL